jgi:hypothetical protein
MKANGEIVYIAGYDGLERPPSDDIIDLLTESFRSDAVSSEYNATALVYDVRVLLPSSEQKSGAIALLSIIAIVIRRWFFSPINSRTAASCSASPLLTRVIHMCSRPDKSITSPFTRRAQTHTLEGRRWASKLS